jgi:hypothetical protein
MEVLCRRVPGGFAPESEAEADKLKKLKQGASVRVTITQETNAKFRRKWFVLARFAFDLWSDTMPEREYRGQAVQPNMERFRKDLTILAGHFTPVWAVNGEMRVEANSLSWSRMNDETFEQFYSATINAILQKILTHSKLTDADMRAHVERVLEFDR